MSDLPTEAAVNRLRTGFLDAHHREVLRTLLLTIERVDNNGAKLPSPVLAAHIVAVTALATGPTAGGAQ